MWTARTSLPKYFYPRPPRGGRRTCLYEAGRDEDISIHALREEGDAAVVLEDYEETKFLSTPSARRATMYSARAPRTSRHFYPRPPRGGRPPEHACLMVGRIFLSTPSARRATKASFLRCTPFTRFLSTPSARRATATPAPWMACGTYFYPRPPRGGRQIVSALAFTCNIISIHALREEGDPPCAAGRGSLWNFYPRPPRGGRPATTSLTSTHKGISIHALREEGDAFQKLLLVFDCLFLSTPSARRATSSTKGSYTTPVTFLSTPSARRATPTAARPIRHPPYFYPRPPRGGRPAAGLTITASTKISIHALREEGDGFWAAQRLSTTVFLSTPSARRATSYASASKSCEHDFYPRPPRGGRLRVDKDKLDAMQFLSTPSARRATGTVRVHLPGLQISIHALREEGDRW